MGLLSEKGLREMGRGFCASCAQVHREVRDLLFEVSLSSFADEENSYSLSISTDRFSEEQPAIRD